MPIQWEYTDHKAPDKPGAFSFADGDGPALRLTLWPHRSLPASGFVWFIGVTFAMFMLPLLALLGTAALWGLLPFLMGALALIWYSLRRSSAQGQLREVLSLWHDHVDLSRHNPHAPDQNWQANPHWVQIKLRPIGGPVENYVTLRGNDRTVEIGAFLSADERLTLYVELQRAFSR
ncbi:MAG: DUF2244 domain-containing protein [Paracoccaceae bacterium]